MSRLLTPKERAAITARYQQVANASQVAREFGVDEKTVRRIAGASKPNRADIHARACARAVRAARRSLARRIESVDMYLLNAVDANARVPGTIGLEPRDFSAVLNAQSNLTARLLDTQERIERRQQARLTRERTRAEIEFLKARTAAIDGLASALAGATDEELATVQTILDRAKKRGLSPGTASGTSAPQSGDDPSDEPR